MDYLRKKVESAPSSCGVYIFLSDGKPIYIGKSKNIKERLKAYIQFSDSRETVPKIVLEANDIKWIITPTEDDAFFVEQNLIKQHLPKYNIRLKDIKGLKYVKLNMGYEFPSISLTRIKKDSALYFGPFSARDAKEIFDAVRKAFGIRACNETKYKSFKKLGRPCVDGHIGICLAPCVGKADIVQYRKSISRAIDFMKGKFSQVISALEKKMFEEADKENFELAAKIRDQISILKRSLDYKRVMFDDFRSADFVGYDIAFGKICVYAVRVREGRFFGGYNAIFKYGGQDIPELIINFALEENQSNLFISDAFSEEIVYKDIVFRPPNSDTEKQLVQIAKNNATESILQLPHVDSEKFRLLQELGKFLLLPEIPRKIEVFDFSNFGGKNLVGVKVHFEDGEIIPSRLRLYNVSQFGYDDILALKNVLSRRIKDFLLMKDTPFPDLILVDGGKGHFSSAKEILENFKINVALACVKKEERNTRNITLIVENEELKPRGKLLSFILKLRDSAHNRAKHFAVSSATKIK